MYPNGMVGLPSPLLSSITYIYMYLGFPGFLHMHEIIGHYGGKIHPKMDIAAR